MSILIDYGATLKERTLPIGDGEIFGKKLASFRTPQVTTTRAVFYSGITKMRQESIGFLSRGFLSSTFPGFLGHPFKALNRGTCLSNSSLM